MSASPRAPVGRLGLGWSALDDGRWGDARALLEQAVAHEPSARAFEGLSWAAWWLDDAHATFAARHRAHRLYLDAGDAADAARMAVWLAADELDFNGALSAARGWLQRAHRLLDPLPQGPDHGWLAFHDGYVAHICGEVSAAQELAREAAAMGRRFGVCDLEMLGLGLEGAGLVASVDVAEGMRRLDEATTVALAEEASIPMSQAWTFCFLVSACTAVRDFERAFEWCDRIGNFARRYRSRYMLGFCRADHGVVHLWRGQWREAETALLAAIDDFRRSRPAMVAGPAVALAELRRRQGRTEEARRLLADAGPTPAAQLCRARLALDDGDDAVAIGLLERALRQLGESPGPAALPALELLVRALIADGRLDDASAAVAQLHRLGARIGTRPVRAGVLLATGALAAARGEHGRARPALEDAVDCFERCDLPYDAAQARSDLAATLRALGDHEGAVRETAAARRSLAQLGAVAPTVRPVGPRVGGTALTPREREVVRLLADGLTNAQIAERLVVSGHTVHRHVANILRKLGVPSRAAAAAHAARSGLLEHPLR